MSLLMDALRKAEEAKKKAAQENKSEEAVPAVAVEKQQANVVAEKASEDSPASEIKLSMAAMEEVATRSAVPNLEAPIEFEDEEDYVLPTSVAVAKEPAAGNDAILEQSPSSEDVASGERASPESEQRQELNTVLEAFDFDSFESEEDNTAASSEAAPASDKKISDKKQNSRVIAKVAEQAKDRARNTDEPGRKTARSVFAAKKSPLLKSLNIKAMAGGALALFVVAFGTYFYISIIEESTFNIPVGSYVATEFVDDGVSLGADGDQLSIDVATVTRTEEMAAINAGDSAPGNLFIPGDVDVDAGDASAVPSVADTLIESSTLEIVAVSEASRSAENLQPETSVEETPQPKTGTTTVADTPAVAVESEIVVQPVASIGIQSAALVEPTSLISFRKQEAVVTVDPNVDRAYAAYQQGSLDQAEVLYRQTLAADPMQRDALLGLANITARNGNSTEALDLYSRLLARNPSDPIARAGLMELLPAGSPSEQEAELRRLLNDHPDIAALSYAYGNFLASNQRWSEAQQAYFRALQLAKSDAALNGLVNPDYAFNLAVSLEHLNQSEPAQNYYREALGYSANHPAGFDLTAVRSRLANLVGSSNDE
jgi:tetratricopeptide (TPR) repeat protein